jgi:hypothetical protein
MVKHKSMFVSLVVIPLISRGFVVGSIHITVVCSGSVSWYYSVWFLLHPIQ